MLKFFKILTHDPILIITTFVLVAAVVILVWALIEYFGFARRGRQERAEHFQPQPDTPEHNHRNHHNKQDETLNMAPSSDADPYVLFEARMREVSSQLTDIAKKVAALEKHINQKTAAEQTVPGLAGGPAEMEKFIQRIEKRLELMSSDKGSAPSDALSKLEARIEGIHKLLIMLTDSGGASEQK